MKKIKIGFSGIPNHICEEYTFVKILKERYEVEISDNPDYVFCGPLNRYGFCKFSGVRIHYGLECFYPDMNLHDYAITYTDMPDTERHLHVFASIYNPKALIGYEEVDQNEIKRKTKFCNYIYSHAGMRERTEIFNVISKYKKVDAAGRWLNNMDGFTPGPVADWDEKIAFQRQYKFSIAVENYSYPLYSTEKITDAFRAKTIPIYYGDPRISEYINDKAFINLHKYDCFEDALAVIEEIDNNDEKYIEMLNQPKFVDETYLEHEVDKLRKFLFNIFDQDYEKAFRRPCFFWPKKHEIQLLMADYSFKRKEIGNIFTQYFDNNGINSIAIYGQGEVYSYLKDDILHSGVEIECIVETFAKETTINRDRIKVVASKDIEAYGQVDAILVTTSYIIDEIQIGLETLGINKKLISIESVLASC